MYLFPDLDEQQDHHRVIVYISWTRPTSTRLFLGFSENFHKTWKWSTRFAVNLLRRVFHLGIFSYTPEPHIAFCHLCPPTFSRV